MATEGSSIFNNSTVALPMNSTEASASSSFDDFAQPLYYYPLRWVESIIGAIGNALVIAAVVRYKHLRTPTGSLIANLAGTNLLSACLMPLTAAVESMDRSANWRYMCSAKILLYVITLFGNVFNLTIISIDRLVCLTKPFWYAKHVNLALTLACQAFMWVVILLTTLLINTRSTITEKVPTCFNIYFLSKSDLLYFLLCPYYILTIITLGNYAILAVLMWNQGRKILANNSSASANAIIQSRHRQLTRVTAIVVMCYLLLTLPAAIATSEGMKNSALAIHLRSISYLLWHMNSVINPFIYALRIPKFRVAFRKLLGLQPKSVSFTPPAQPTGIAVVG